MKLAEQASGNSDGRGNESSHTAKVSLDELRDRFDAEKQLVRALPKMVRRCDDTEHQNAFREHLEVTKEQVERLERGL